MTDTKSLRELAERALTDWPIETGREQPIWQAMRVLKPIANPETHYGAGVQSDFITHANPAAIIALLDENAVLTKERDRQQEDWEHLAGMHNSVVAELNALKKRTEMSLGVGDENLYVYGDYAATKACQEKLFRMESLAVENAELAAQNQRAEARIAALVEAGVALEGHACATDCASCDRAGDVLRATDDAKGENKSSRPS